MSEETQKTIGKKFEDWERKNHTFFLIIVGLILLWALTPILISLFYGAELGDESAKIGDTFNWFSSLTTGLATLMLVYSISLQRRDLAKQSEQLDIQREELILTREEMENQRTEMAATARALESQVEVAALTAQLNAIRGLSASYGSRTTALANGLGFDRCDIHSLLDVRSEINRVSRIADKIDGAIHEALKRGDDRVKYPTADGWEEENFIEDARAALSEERWRVGPLDASLKKLEALFLQESECYERLKIIVSKHRKTEVKVDQ